MTDRTVTLALCTPDGHLLGALPPYDVDSPWWPEAAPVVGGARRRYGAEVTVLRRIDDGCAGAEPDERVYHARDPVTWLRRAARLSLARR